MSAANDAAARRLRVLVADDAPFNRLLLRSVLELEHCQVSEAEDGAAAMRLLTTTAIDIVFLDLRMPNLDGMQVLQQYRSLPASPAKMYIVSTDMSQQQESALLAAGANGVLARPIAPDAIQALLRAC